MLAYLSLSPRGEADALLADLAAQLGVQGVALAGAVQVNRDGAPGHKCDMDLHILAGAEVVRISQDLGALADGCRLDPDGLERAVGLVQAALEAGPDLVIVNKFGKQELAGRGFCPVIGTALAAGIPVLTAVSAGNVAGFCDWAGDLAVALPPEADAVMDWAQAQIAARAEGAGGQPPDPRRIYPHKERARRLQNRASDRSLREMASSAQVISGKKIRAGMRRTKAAPARTAIMAGIARQAERVRLPGLSRPSAA